MLQTRKSVKIAFLHNVSTYLLACVFSFGFITGCTVVCSDSVIHNLLIQCAVAKRASITVFGGHVLVPFLLTLLICRSGRIELLHILCFILAFGYGMVSIAVNLSFGSASWLIHPLLLFTATVTLASLFHFWLRLMSSQPEKPEKELLFSFGISILSSVADYFLISPYLLSLFT